MTDDQDAKFIGRQERVAVLGGRMEARFTRAGCGIYYVERSKDPGEEGMITSAKLHVLLGPVSAAKLHDEIGAWLKELAGSKK